MQYILTEKEYDELRWTRNEREKKEEEKLLKFCIRVSNELPVKLTNDLMPHPWNCFLDPDSLEVKDNNTQEFCDNCPSEEICPYSNKEYSK